MRARWLKPEFFRDRKIGKLGPVAALVFQSLWCTADDGGVSLADPEIVWGEMFCYWPDVTLEAVTAALSALSNAGRIEMYAIGDVQYAAVRNWRHQRVHKPSAFRHPRAAGTVPEAKECRTSDAPLPDHTGTPRLLDSYTPRHLDSKTPACVADACDNEEQQPPTNSKRRNTSLPEFEEFWKIYPARTGGANKQGALRMWTARIAEGLTPAFLIERASTYGSWCTAEKITGTTKVMMASTFLGRDRRYEDDYTVTALKLESAPSGPRTEPERYSREWLQKNGYPLPPADTEEVA